MDINGEAISRFDCQSTTPLHCLMSRRPPCSFERLEIHVFYGIFDLYGFHFR
jgi:hypothetical protein